MSKEIKCPHCGGNKSKQKDEDHMGSSGLPMQTRICLMDDCGKIFKGFYE